MLDNNTLWEKVLVEVELQISKANFSTWFKNTYIFKKEEGVVQLAVPNEFVKEWLKNKFHKSLIRSLRENDNNVRALEYVVKQERKDQGVIQKIPPTFTQNTAFPLEDLYLNKEDNLNPRYTFDSMIVGSFNELAHAAARSVVENPGISYNPLFIYGDSGLGKTHIAQAIGNHIKAHYPNKKIYYIPSEKFAIDYVNSVQENKANQFKEKYRKYDLIIMDDIQFLAGKEKTQEELFHLFNSLYESNKQIIFSSDVHPIRLPGIEDRLKTRFSAGMIVDITFPEHEAKMAIINHKAKMSEYILPPETVDFIASSLHCSIRELEGVVNNIICQSKLLGRNVNIIELKELVKNNIKQKKRYTAKEVVEIVAQFYHVDKNAIYEKTRRKEVVKPRQVAMYILREDINESYPSIGENIGGRDHTTVIHSCEKIKNDLKTNSVLMQEMDQLRAMFR
ncbi:MAG TPA: chromosomal replication initiator protein DnaA [Candidatus Paceibacterota bacterium]|nr:chromosomal replication initiator protein DnaA [Candidatus Paceibacterota bacterium]